MKRSLVLSLFLILTLWSCHQKKEIQTAKENDSNTSLRTKDSLTFLMTNLDKIEIKNFEKGHTESSIPDSLICKKWSLSKNDLSQIIRTTKLVDFDDIHYLFETQTCIYTGIFVFEQEEYDFVINSGGWIHLKFNNMTLGCFNTSCEQFFIGKVDNPEEEFIKK